MSRTTGGGNAAARSNQASTGSQSSGKPLASRNSVSSSPSPRPNASTASTSQSATSAQSSPGNATGLLKEYKSLVGQSVKLSLEDGHDILGLLWSYDAQLGVVALEIPRAAAAILQGQASGSVYPSKAVAAPTAVTSSVKVAAQGVKAKGGLTRIPQLQLN
jgi:hypothetical protein